MSATSDRLRKQAKKVAKDLHGVRVAAADVAHEKLREIRKNGSQHYNEGRSKVYQFEHQVVQIIRERPFRSALIAAGAGAVFGGYWIRRLMKAQARR